MFTQDLVSEEETLTQCGLSLSSDGGVDFERTFARLLGAWTAVDIRNLSVRYVLKANRPVEAIIVATVSADAKDEIRKFMARIALLEGYPSTELTVPESKSHFMASLSDWPQLTIVDDDNLQTASGIPVLSLSLAADKVMQIVARMDLLGAPVWFQANMGRYQPDADTQKHWSRTVLELERADAPKDLRDQQRDIFDMARRADVHVETFWGTSKEYSETLKRMLDDAQSQQQPLNTQHIGRHKIFDQAVVPALECLHSWELFGQPEIEQVGTAGFSTISGLDPLFRWPKVTRSMGARSGSAGGDRSGVHVPRLPAPSSDPGSAFISYAHSDAGMVYPHLDAFEKSGLRFWYDKGIAIGSDWNEELERRLSSAGIVIAFISERSVQSRYCRREIKYADIIGKPIAPIRLDNAALEGALSFILSDLQQFDHQDPSLVTGVQQLLEGAQR